MRLGRGFFFARYEMTAHMVKYGTKRDPELLYEQDGAVTLRPFSSNPSWWLWQECIPRVSCSQGYCEEFIVVPRENAVKTNWATTQDEMPYLVRNSACYVLSVVVNATEFPVTLKFKFLDDKWNTVHTQNPITYIATKGTTDWFTIKSKSIPVYCCILVKDNQPTLRRSRRRRRDARLDVDWSDKWTFSESS